MIVEDWKSDTFSVVAVQVQDRLVVVTDSDVTQHITNSGPRLSATPHSHSTTSNHKDWVPGTLRQTPNLFPKKRRWLRVFTFYPTNAAYIIKTKCHYY